MSEVRSITYCSYAVPGKCLGVIILEGELDPVAADMQVHRLGLSPGNGQLMAVSFKEIDTDIPEGAFEVMWSNKNRIISDIEARILFEGASIEELEGTAVQN